MKTKYKYLFVALLLSVGIWFYFTPHMTIQNIKLAAESKDADTLSKNIDYPKLKESIKNEFKEKLSGGTEKQENNSIASLGSALTLAFVGSVVDNFVTPEGLNALFTQGNTSQRRGKSKNNTPSESDIETSMAYENFNRFAVKISDREVKDEPVYLIFHRDGWFNWKLSGIRFDE